MRKFVEFLYSEQPRSADLLIAIISCLLGFAGYVAGGDADISATESALEHIMPIEIWGLALLLYGIALIVGTVTKNSRLRVLASGFGTFNWFAIVSTLLIYSEYNASMRGIIIYGMFALFSMWGFISAQEEYRLIKLYGKHYQRTIEEETLKEIIALQRKVTVATKQIETELNQNK